MTAPDESTLAKVRKILAMAEGAATQAEAEAFTAKAAALMAKYGIDEAMAAQRGDQKATPANRIVDVPNPWSRVHATLLGNLAQAMRCQGVQWSADEGMKVHLFGFAPDLERVEMLYTSVLLQMSSALSRQRVPAWESPRAWRRSWLLGYVGAVLARVRDAEARATADATAAEAPGQAGRLGRAGTAVVLRSRDLAVQAECKATYPSTRTTRATYSGNGYSSGRAAGERANLGGTGVGSGSRRALA